MCNKISRIIMGACALMCASLQMSAETVTLKRYEVNVKDFTSLDVVDSYNVEYRCSEDSAGMAVYETTAEMADNIIFENNKGKLSIQKPFHQPGELSEGLPTIAVYYPERRNTRQALMNLHRSEMIFHYCLLHMQSVYTSRLP